jgi:tetratricopeptide (TPR) repeat protein
MSSKNKRGAEGSPTAGRTPRQEVDRLIAKGWFKDAIKQAKLLHRAEPTPEHHRLLERAYLLRAQQLRDGGMPQAAQEVAGHLLDFKITDPELTEPAAALMLAVGLGRQAFELQGRLDSPEAIERLARQAADQAVLHPERASAASPEIRDGAKRVRSALEALATRGDGSDALAGLRDVARNSPFADWRLFARGLAAFHRGEDADARANWDRLDPNRAASRIARGLTGATEHVPLDSPPSPKLEAQERRAFGEPVLGPLRELGDLVAQGLWPEAVRKLVPVRLALRRLDPALAVRLTQALYPLVIEEATGLGYHEGQDLLKGFTRAAEPLPIDPRWNRLWALAWEGPQGHPEEAAPFWRKFIDDLEASPAIQADERPLARALVLTHRGRDWARFAQDIDPPEERGPRRKVDEEAMEARRMAVTLFEESLSLSPSHRATYQALMDVYEDDGQTDKAAGVAERLLKALPDDFDTLEFLTNYHDKRDEPTKALEFALRARKLKPLDQNVLMSEWACRAVLARHHALKARFDDARSELDAAAKLRPEIAGSPNFSARKACLEIKAGALEAAKEIIDEAVERLPEPAPLWLAMAIEARRFQIPKVEIDRYEGKWQAAASGKVRGETAGALANLLGPFLSEKINYPEREEHIEQVMAYLRRTTRIKYSSRDDLANACTFAVMVPKQGDLVEKLAKRGLTLFPDAPDFPMMLGTIEMEKGPFRADVAKARKSFESALKLAQQASDPKAAAMVPQIKNALSVVTDLLNSPMGMPFASGGKGAMPASLLDAFEAMMREQMDDDFFGPDDDDDEGWAAAPTPSPRPRSKKKKKR